MRGWRLLVLLAMLAVCMPGTDRLLAEDRGATVGGDGSSAARNKTVSDYTNEYDTEYRLSAGVVTEAGTL